MNKIVALVGLCLMSGWAVASECPVKFGDENYGDQVIAKIEKANSCFEASQIAEVCALGSSFDGFSVPYAIKKCEEDFFAKLSPSELLTYGTLMNKCDKKYADMEGTMYVSLNAFCNLSVAKLYSELFTPAE